MTCKECAERREKLIDAVIEGRIAAAAGHVFKGAAEMVGLKAKPVLIEAVFETAEPVDEGGLPADGADEMPVLPTKKYRASRS